MKKFTYFVILAGLLLQSCSTTSQLKYAEQLYKEKQFAESVKVLRSIKDPDAKTYLLLANAEFQLSHMQRAAQAYEHIPLDSLSEKDKANLSVALHQSKMVITDTSLTQLELVLTPLFADEFADENCPFYSMEHFII
jgi:tetratricopeptide (TPR) repeat protein